MNKALKITLITIAVGVPSYILIRKAVIKKRREEAALRYKEGDTEKRLLINQLLIIKGIDATDAEINKYLKYSVEEISNLISEAQAQTSNTQSLIGNAYGSTYDAGSGYNDFVTAANLDSYSLDNKLRYEILQGDYSGTASIRGNGTTSYGTYDDGEYA